MWGWLKKLGSRRKAKTLENSEQFLIDAILLLKNKKYEEFDRSQDKFFSAYLLIADEHSITATRLLMNIEAERPQGYCADFFQNAMPHIQSVLARVTAPTKKKHLYNTILKVPVKNGMGEFLIKQCDDLSSLLSGEYGRKTSQLIIAQSVPKTADVLKVYNQAFQHILETPPAKPLPQQGVAFKNLQTPFSLSAEQKLLARCLYKAYRRASVAPPEYLTTMATAYPDITQSVSPK